MNILLIGMMGSGKSSIGGELAGRLGARFVDLDLEVERAAGKSVRAIFEDGGEDEFRLLESEALGRLVSEGSASGEVGKACVCMVIAVGGGAPVFGDNMRKMKELGKVVYLRASVEELMGRLSGTSAERPMLRGDGIKERLIQLLDERRSVYEQADATIDVDGRTMDDVVRELEEMIRGWK